jgi:hypothetical protein
MTKGFVIMAQNTKTVSYTKCAKALELSIKKVIPNSNITIITSDMLPYGDLGGYLNDWQIYEASPYDETIKLEADMLIASSIDHWWSMFRHRDLVVSTGCRNWHGEISLARDYRAVFDHNCLPDVYNAITYWRLSETAREFFNLTHAIFNNWTEFRTLLKFAPDTPDTDLVYAMAAQIMGPERVTLPFASYPKIVHMKRHIAGTQTEDWTRELNWEYRDYLLRVSTVAQSGAFHYNVKEWHRGLD